MLTVKNRRCSDLDSFVAHRRLCCVETPKGGGGGGGLAGHLCTDAQTKDYKNYPKQCV